MLSLKRASAVMRYPLVYRLWQAPVAATKLGPILRHNDLGTVRRVLDVGCGPGTNAPLFAGVDYLGIDFNESYVASARRRYGHSPSAGGNAREFAVADARTYTADPDDRFDFILLNSLLHHLADGDVVHLLSQLAGQLVPGGHVHILDLVLPDSPGIARRLALSDRGDYPRSLDDWGAIFRGIFEEVVFEPYAVGAFGVPLWNMVYFKGTAKRS